ncbi:dipeptide/oligopeptide/nickel ABC transporter permease/ATP-binding protein [Roseomonas eburnea]|uniref:Dipeptide/oligopeptide/nickel ABC transporter permease/ATP-binding protein n=1 Tax=Neoroseomonas eburnea TaxID=1346889 RepID=A0A9X9X9M0_9PROT|nr:dipeptide/oligopeptide/nickel ABC transporter permease/ATP-binding protein [Neoroseomonas eburnea]MBR0680406.1 dipeptide/oligopeptide/nickel ABC transporter permease/ATP-binding protein [Neoroseomonas eburnea]
MRRIGLRALAVPGLISLAILLVAVAVPLLPLADPVRQDVANRLAGPSAAHWLGQDEYGRDVLSRILWGARVSLSVAFAATAVAAVIGTLLGILGGYFRGVVELATVRVAEIVLCFPPLLLALLVVTLLGPGAGTLIFSLSILFAPGFARVAYGETLSARALDYVTAQEALGAPTGRILVRTLLPNIAAPLIVQFSLTVASAMVLESGLSFLGLGVVPPSPSWGLMIRGARATMEQAPLLLAWPCLALTLTVLLLNLLCDRLRDALDPRGRAAGRPGFLRRVLALPAAAAPGASVPGLLAVEGLTLQVPGPAGPVQVVRDVGFSLAPGETLAIVGESGSGKTLTGLAIMGLLPPAVTPVAGRILFTGRDGSVRDLLRLPEREMRRLRGRDLSMIFQDPSSSLNPLVRIGVQVAESLRAHGVAEGVKGRVVALLRQVGLPDPERQAMAYPHEVSGGQRQRVMIAAAIANHPRLLLADEPTTALDVTVQAQILALLAALKRAEGVMGMVFVTHNLAVVADIADRAVVMYAGEVVEEGPVAELFAAPRHPYTAALIASMPEGEADRLTAIPGAVPQPWAMPAGCRFAPRCAMAMEACGATSPALAEIAPGRATRCLRWKEMA